MILHKDFEQAKKHIFDTLNLKCSDLIEESEGKEYGAAYFKLDNQSVLLRSSKITPKKIGQFVTIWKRNKNGITEPHNIDDAIDIVIISSRSGNHFGQFVFPIRVLEQKGIISSSSSKGKRGFRIYAPWDNPTSPQAIKSQRWQLDYFIKINKVTNIDLARKLYTVT